MGKGEQALRADGTAPATDEDVLRRYPKLLHRVPAVLYIAEPGEDGRWHYASPQIESVLGFTAEEWCSSSELRASHLHPDDRPRTLAKDGEQTTPNVIGFSADEYRMLRRDGSVVWIRDEAQLVRGADGVALWHGVLSDISDRKLIEAELERRAAQQAALAKIGEHALEGAETEHLLDEAVNAAARLLDVPVAAMAQYLPEQEHFVVRSGYNELDITGPSHYHASAETQAGFTMLTRTPVIVEDWENDERFLKPPPHWGLRSGVSVLIEGAHGTFGVLAIAAQEPRKYRPDEIAFLQALANVLADALERQAIEDDIRHRALHDPLTALPNRVLFLDRIEQALARMREHPSLAAVLFLDFDHFKVINDSLGHHVGDELLTAAAPRLKRAVRACDTVARFGGDEFAILLEDIEGPEAAIQMAERLAALFSQPFIIAGSEHFVSASIGIALAKGGELPMELIRDADSAMYRAKDRGRSRYEVFDAAMRGRALARLRVENDLRRALDRSELMLEYQPLVSLKDLSLIGVEALVRWRHPQRGLVSPAEFVPVAEENGLIVSIGRWVLQRACRDAAQWNKVRPEGKPLEISVNLSAVQLAKPGLADVVRIALEASGLDPSTLCLEITETAMLRELEEITEALEALGALGVRLALDDFGTGYSSLSYLPHLPLDILKIDRSFVDGLGTQSHDTAITEAIIAMSRALSLSVVAEGVEHEGQVRELTRLGCEIVQGFHFSRPVSAAEITAIVTDGPRWQTRSQRSR